MSNRLQPTAARDDQPPRLKRHLSQTEQHVLWAARLVRQRTTRDTQTGTLSKCRRFIVKARTGSSSIRQTGTSHRMCMSNGMRIVRSSGSSRCGWLAAVDLVRQNFNTSNAW